MVTAKSLDELELIAALLSDAQTLHSEVLSPRALRLTIQKIEKRYAREGIGFLTKTLPRLGKAFDRALTGEVPLDSIKLAFKCQPNSQLPIFLGELFRCVFSHDGWILPSSCVKCIKTIRQILYCFYKYKLPYDSDDENSVIAAFKDTETEITDNTAPTLSCMEAQYSEWLSQNSHSRSERSKGDFEGPFPSCSRLVSNCGNTNGHQERPACKGNPLPHCRLENQADSRVSNLTIVHRARVKLEQLFSTFDPMHIQPKHGPGAVSTKEKLWGKYVWTNVSHRLTSTYPLDAYFYASLSHVCDRLQEFQSLEEKDSYARVCLVPKDSRGPRLISCEPVDFQWIQQGLGRAIVKHVERHPLTRYNVHFTNQQPNQFGALYGSQTGLYSTLDLKEASDRVSVELVRLLFPTPLFEVLKNCRTLGTELPGGEVLMLKKFAPMGSALCFPILALTVWALLTAGCPDADTRERILVYGDDVIVPTAYAGAAISILESFGLKVNRDKSCCNGFFRESCGVDAFKGVNVTPIRFRTVWTSLRSPDVYISWICYANSLYDRRFYHAYDYIVQALCRSYGEIPDDEMNLSSPSLRVTPEKHRPSFRRSNSCLQKLEWRVWDVKSRSIMKEIDGWSMLLRYFAEAGHQLSPSTTIEATQMRRWDAFSAEIADSAPFSVSQYTKRSTSILVKCWR